MMRTGFTRPELVIVLTLLAIVGWGLQTGGEPVPPVTPCAVTVTRLGGKDLSCTHLFTNPQGLLAVRTTSGDWALVGPTGELLVWVHDPGMVADLERQAQVEQTRKVFQQ